MIKEITPKMVLLAALMLTYACNSPDKKEVSGDTVANVGSGMDPKRDTGFTPKRDDAPQDAEPGKNLRDYTNESHVDSDDAAFMKTAALGGMMEVDLGKIAQQSSNPQVKAFASLMVADHTKANKELKELAYKTEILLPVEYPADQKEHMEMMTKLSGTEFDKHYIEMMVNDHHQTLALFRTGSQTMSKDVKVFAEKTIPVLERHYVKAKAIQASLK